jgi:hypothetical protein
MEEDNKSEKKTPMLSETILECNNGAVEHRFVVDM